MKTRSLFLLTALLCATISTRASAHSPLIARTQYNASAVVKQADALLGAGHPAQAAALYLRVADDAVAANDLDIAATLYEKAAKAYHLANDPGHEATADEHAANVYVKQAGVTLPADGKTTKPAPTVPPPVRPTAQKAPAQPAAPASAPAPSVQTTPSQDWKVGDRVLAGPGAKIHAATVLEVSSTKHYYHLHFDDHSSPDTEWIAAWDIRSFDAQAQQQSIAAQPRDWKVGERVAVGPAVGPATDRHTATVLEVNSTGHYYHLHFDDHSRPDTEWITSTDLHAIDEQQKLDAAAKLGPRLGKYLILGYGDNLAGMDNGYFVLQPGGKYELFLLGGRKVGSGTYAFNASTTTVHWLSGPFATQGWSGSQKFEVSREGRTDIIRLLPRTIGTNSTDSQH
ncbi:hypothetical protein [Deinococcus sp.]|uniref:hypothetical protein n=1 Tax=Deinococcus sp. TaxID=47478 RepID=UPI003CC55E09